MRRGDDLAPAEILDALDRVGDLARAPVGTLIAGRAIFLRLPTGADSLPTGADSLPTGADSLPTGADSLPTGAAITVAETATNPRTRFALWEM
jgi:hypothetical protein